MICTPESLRTPFAVLLAAPSPAEGIERVLSDFPDLSVDEIYEIAKRARAARLAQMRGKPT